MKIYLLLPLLAGSCIAFPWMRPEDAPDEFVQNAKRGLQVMKRDPELVALIQTLHAQQAAEKEAFFKRSGDTSSEESLRFEEIEKRTTTSNCLSHPLQDFLPTNISGLKKFPEAGYPYQDPRPTDQRGPCPGRHRRKMMMIYSCTDILQG